MLRIKRLHDHVASQRAKLERLRVHKVAHEAVRPLADQDGTGLGQGLKPRSDLTVRIHRANGQTEEIKVLCRIDTLDELEYFRHGGILQYVLRSMMKA